MKRLLLLGALMLPLSSAHAQEPKINCPGENTMGMRYCADQSLKQSTDQLKQKVSKQMLQQWQKANDAVWTHAYAPYKGGSIYPQLAIGCEDRLNRALLKEFRRMGNYSQE